MGWVVGIVFSFGFSVWFLGYKGVVEVLVLVRVIFFVYRECYKRVFD